MLYYAVDAPNPEMRMLLNDPLFLTTVTYLQGTALSEKDLLRARVEKAVGIFIMTNKFSSTPDKEDSKIILQQYSIKSFLNSRDVASMPFFGLQLIRGENLRHLSTAEGSNGGKFNEASTREVSICLNEIKLGLIAKSVMFPGASTLIMNLLTSFSDDDDEDIMPKDSDPDSRTSRSRSRSSSMNGTGFGRSTSARYTLPTENVFRTDEWVDEYKMGCDWEIYKSDLPPLFNGYRFSDLVVLLYERIGIVLIGLLIRDLDDETVPLQVVLNPVDYLIKLDREEMKIQGIMLAKNQVTADVSQLTAANSALTPLNADKGLFSVSRIRGVVNPGARKNALERMAGEDTGGRNSGVQVFTGVADEPPRRKKIDVATLKGQLQKVKESVLSQQEQLKFIEDVFMKDNYYLRERAARLAEVTVHTAVLEEIPHINDHIIITGKGISNLYDLIKPLKAKELGPLKYIVILYPDIIPQSVWQRIAIFDGILVIRGSPLEENDIRRAGIFRASQIVILADVSSTGRILSSQDSNKGNLDMAGLEALIDSDSIFAYKAVKRLNDKTGIVVEFVRESNLEYLNLSGTNNFDGAPVTAIANNAGGKAVVNATKKVALSKSKDFDFRESPLFASGSIFTSSLLDTLVCQTFYNPLILDVVQRFLSQKQDSKPSINAAKIFSGESTMSDRNIASVFDIRGSSLYQIDVPDGYVGRSYFSLVKHLAKENMLPIALYRGVVPQLTLGRLMNHLPYVYTNPKKDAEIFFGDKVFVLAPKGRYSSTLKV